MRILRKPFLQALAKLADGNTHKCVESAEVFAATRLRAYSNEVIPVVIDDLVRDGYIDICRDNKIRITLQGIYSLSRSLENNAYKVLGSVVSHLHGRDFNAVPARLLKRSTNLTNGELRDSVDFLLSTEYIEKVPISHKERDEAYIVKLTHKGRLEYDNVQLETGGNLNCLLIAPAGVQASTISAVLQKKGIYVTKKVEDGRFIPDKISVVTAQSDIVVGVLGPSATDNANVYLELGIALALKKRIFLIISPKLDNVPSSLAIFPHIRAEWDNVWAISFAAEYLMAFPRMRSYRIIGSEKTKPIPEQSNSLLQRLEAKGDNITDQELIEIVRNALRESRVSAISNADSGSDLAIWCDELESVVGNPISIEIKRLLTPKTHEDAIREITRRITGSESRWGILLYYEGKSSENIAIGLVLTIRIRELLEGLKRQSLGQFILERRRRAIHGSQS